MLQIHPEYIVDASAQRRAVVLPLDEWERIVDELDELEDIRLFDQARETADEEVPFDQAMREIEAGAVQ